MALAARSTSIIMARWKCATAPATALRRWNVSRHRAVAEAQPQCRAWLILGAVRGVRSGYWGAPGPLRDWRKTAYRPGPIGKLFRHTRSPSQEPGVLDLWFERVVKPRLRGEAHMIRYIDDFVMCFQYREDALRVQDALCKRLGKFGLTLEPAKTKLVEFGRFAQRHAAKHGRKRPETIYFLGFTLYCTRNLKGNFRIGMRTEKSRLRRSLMSLQDLLRRIRHLSVRDQVNTLNAALRGITPTTALQKTFVPCKRSIGRANATGTKCCAAGAGPGASRGTCSTRSNSGNRSCDQSCTFHIGSYKLSQCCESSSEERSAGNLHATFCGNRGRATASGDPVGCSVMGIPTAIHSTSNAISPQQERTKPSGLGHADMARSCRRSVS
jgi:hypothetical protein